MISLQNAVKLLNQMCPGWSRQIGEDLLCSKLSLDAMNRVGNGVLYLNEEIPDWKERINVDEFTFSNYSKCIMGQLGLFDERYHQTVSRGFNILGHGQATENIYSEGLLLHAFWVFYLTKDIAKTTAHVERNFDRNDDRYRLGFKAWDSFCWANIKIVEGV